MIIFKSVIIFILAGICEIAGGYCYWIWLREGKSPWFALLGTFILTLYGYIATFQPSSFARVYATYGGFFIIMTLLWGYFLDNFRPDRWDIVGSIVIIAGVLIIYYMPRH
jgi:small multidrug resistance family-3 protein